MPTIPETLFGCSAAEQEVLMRSLPGVQALALNWAFPEWAHSGQVAPAGDWRTWVLMAGRGFGKTRAGAEWVLGVVRGAGFPSRLREGLGVGECAASEPAHPRPLPQAGGENIRIALVAATVDEARRVMVEGPSGLLACARPGEIAEWSRSHGELTFASGARATLYSGANPEALR